MRITCVEGKFSATVLEKFCTFINQRMSDISSLNYCSKWSLATKLLILCLLLSVKGLCVDVHRKSPTEFFITRKQTLIWYDTKKSSKQIQTFSTSRSRCNDHKQCLRDQQCNVGHSWQWWSTDCNAFARGNPCIHVLLYWLKAKKSKTTAILS